jgi:signal transduction histidine kinase/ABC-type uncharacterized transport system substrate-binding protein
MEEGIKQGFADKQIRVNLHVEFLNSWFWAAEGEEAMMRLKLRRAAAKDIDLIITSNDEALYSLMACGDSLPYQVPVVYFGVEYPNAQLMSKFPKMTGLESPHRFDELLKTAKQVFPDRKNIYLLSEDNILGRRSINEFMNAWEPFVRENPAYTIRQYDVTNDPMTVIVGRMQLATNAHENLMIVPYWGVFMSSVAKVTRFPTFAVSAMAMSQGAFLSLSPDMHEDARKAAHIAADILNGQSISSIPMAVSDEKPFYDNAQLKFFRYPQDKLPADSVILRQSFSEKYGKYIMAFYIVVLSLLLSLIVFLIHRNRLEARKRTQTQMRLLVQNHLVEQRNEFDNIFHSISEGIVTYDTHLRITFLNRAAQQMLGVKETVETSDTERPFEGLNAGSQSHIYHEQKEILIDMLKDVAETGRSIDIPDNSYMRNRLTKNYFPIAGDIVPVFVRGQQTGIVLTFRNVSEETRDKRMFNLAVDVNQIYPHTFDPKTMTFTWPASFCERMGYASTTVTQQQYSEKVHPDDLPAGDEAFIAMLTGKADRGDIIYRMKNAQGVYEWMECQLVVQPAAMEDDSILLLGIGQSVQRFKDAEDALADARDKAMEADRLKSAFLANMSHEIRTPLNSIVGFSDILKDYKIFSEEEVEQFIETINKNCSMLLVLINDILDLSRIESSALDFHLAPYYLPIIMQEIYDSQVLNMPEGVQLIKETPTNSDKTIITDNVRLKQVINNLINNAVKFTANGFIKFGYTEEEGWVQFFVQDTGKGMSEEAQKRVFERFYKEDSFTQGTGLGLSISQTIVGRLRGSIWLESELGKGTTFYVRLPDKAE